MADFPTILVPRLYRAFHSRLPLSLRVPTVLSYCSTGISTCCPSATALALTLGPDSPRADQLYLKPWIFGLEDSHLYLATHSGILSSMQSTAPYGTASPRMQCSSTNVLLHSLVSVARFSPGHFRRMTSRPVSYYALFEWMAASEPTSWLSFFEIPHPFPLNAHFGTLTVGLGSFPFDRPTYLVQSDSR